MLELRSHMSDPLPCPESREVGTVLSPLHQMVLCQRPMERRRIWDGKMKVESSHPWFSCGCDVYEPNAPWLDLQYRHCPRAWANTICKLLSSTKFVDSSASLSHSSFSQHPRETGPRQKSMRCFLRTCQGKATQERRGCSCGSRNNLVYEGNTGCSMIYLRG